MKKIGLNAARRSLGQIARQTATSEAPIVLTDRGKAVAAIVPISALGGEPTTGSEQVGDAREAQRDSEQRLRDFADAASDWFWETDEEHRFTWFSDRFQDVLGLEPADRIGKSRFSLRLPDDADPKWKQHREDLEARRPFRDFVYSYKDTDGRVRTIQIHGKPVFDEDGRFRGYRGSGSDMTAHVRAQARADKAELLLHDALESMPGAILICDAEGRARYWNRQFSDVAGVPTESLWAGRTFEEIVREAAVRGNFKLRGNDLDVYVAERMESFWNPGAPFNISLADGRLLHVEERRTRDGGLVSVRVDVTEIESQRQQLAESEARFRDFAETASDWFWETDAGLRMSYVSDRMSDAVGVDPEQIMGRTREDLMSTEPDRAKVEAHLEGLRARRPFHDFRYRYQTVDGRTVHVSINGRPQFGAGGEFIGYRGTATNVTHMVEAAHELEIAKEQAERASRAKSEFLANMSHELRTPLNAVIGFSQVLSSQQFGPIGNPKYLEYARDICTSGEHLLSLINDLLDLSKIEAGRFELRAERLDVAALARNCVHLVEKSGRPGRVVLDVDVPPALPSLFADERAVKQMLLNLLTNAMKFTDEGGSVRLSADVERGGSIRLSVADTGTGIASGDLEKVLAPFSQADNAFTRGGEGTGLGLPLVKSIIELHGGSLEIDSAPGRGTTVTLRFPAHRTIANRERHARHAEPAAAAVSR